MKATNKILALALMAVAMVFASCSKDDDVNNVPSQQEIESKIVGKWKSVNREGIIVTTNNRDTRTYNQGGDGSSSTSSFKAPKNAFQWSNHVKMTYDIKGNELHDKVGEQNYERYMSVISVNENDLSVMVNKRKVNGNVLDQVFPMQYSKMTADYSRDIIGMWEGVEVTGYETYGNAEHRIEYKADGSCTYYNKVDGYWVPSTNVDNEYNVDGDWLATRWRPEAGADYNYEWWDIDYIKDGMMKWSALREKEDGTRFTTTFTWKKVDDSASSQNIKANIVGSWQIDHVVRYEITDGNVIHKDIIPYDFMVSTISYTSDLTFSTYDYFVDSEQPDAKIDETRAQGRYSVADRQITHTFDDEPSKMYSNMVYSIDSQTMVIINHYIEGKTEFFSLTYYRKL